MKKIRFYFTLLRSDRAAFQFQLWMVYNRYKINTLKWGFTKFFRARGTFITVHERPIRANEVGTWSDSLKMVPPIAIVIQGRLVTDSNFTLETITIYKKNFPDAFIIISTDTDANPETLTQLVAAGAYIVKSDRPSCTGFGNVNLQLISTLAGLKKAQELGAEYAYKTRTDQRVYAVNISEFLLNLIHAFPAAPGFSQKYRIIASSFLTLKYVPYLITDMFQFGHIDDMVEYWSAPLDMRTGPVPLTRTVQEATDARIAESYLVTEYLKLLGRTIPGTIADSWDVYAKHFCIVDRETLDLFWYKYNFYQEYSAKFYGGISNTQLLTFAEWFNLYSNSKNKKSVPTTGLQLTRQDYLPLPSTL